MALLSRSRRAASRIGALGAILVCASVPRAAAQPSEHEVKAAFLYSFTKFVEWPAAALGEADEPFTFCLLGGDPFEGTLDGVVRGKRVQGRPAAVRRIDGLAQVAGCRILFVAASESSRVPEIVAALRERPVLTVGDHEGFVGTGGMINFVLRQRRVRFQIDQAAAEAAGLAVSAKLLDLAERVVASGRSVAPRGGRGGGRP